VDAGYAGPPCSFCDDFGLLTLNDGTKLRSVASGIPRRGKGLYEPEENNSSEHRECCERLSSPGLFEPAIKST
jgi:hypothetical protein